MKHTDPDMSLRVAGRRLIALISEDVYFSEIAKAAIEKSDLLKITARFGNSRQFLSECDTVEFNTVILDFGVVPPEGVSFINCLRSRWKDLKIFVYIDHPFPAYTQPLYEAGASLCLQKHNLKLLEKALLSIGQCVRRRNDEDFSADDLVLIDLVCNEYTLYQIGERMNLSSEAIKKRKQHLTEKIGIHNSELSILKWAISNGYYMLG